MGLVFCLCLEWLWGCLSLLSSLPLSLSYNPTTTTTPHTDGDLVAPSKERIGGHQLTELESSSPTSSSLWHPKWESGHSWPVSQLCFSAHTWQADPESEHRSICSSAYRDHGLFYLYKEVVPGLPAIRGQCEDQEQHFSESGLLHLSDFWASQWSLRLVCRAVCCLPSCSD